MEEIPMSSRRSDVRVALASPYPLSSAKGNTVSVRRIGGILRELGYAARESHGWDGEPAEILISLHATRGAEAVRRYREAHPDGKVVVVFTGTDLYQSLLGPSPEGEACLAAADRLVVSQEGSLRSVPEKFRGKARVVPQSVELDIPDPRPEREPGVFDIVVVGHLRAVKDPFMTVRVMHERPDWREVRVWQLGEELEEGFAKQARQWERREPRFRWLGGVPRREVIEWLCRAAVMVNSSEMEGGSNAVAEAMMVGTPVVASRVEGNVGMLGEDYEGYFEPGDAEDLAARLQDLRGFGPAWENLRRQVTQRSQLFQRDREQAEWHKLLDGLWP
jgi:putative glycosyltransferase (TIGR04348 family)